MKTTADFLQVWLSIYQESIQLCDAIDALPDDCECGDAEAHLEGRCPCCREHRQSSGAQTNKESCTVLLTRLRADLTFLCQDFALLATQIDTAVIGSQGLELRRGLFLAAGDLHKIAKTVDRLDEEVVGFRKSCDLSHLHSMKRTAIELRQHFIQLNVSLTASTDTGPSKGQEDL